MAPVAPTVFFFPLSTEWGGPISFSTSISFQRQSYSSWFCLVQLNSTDTLALQEQLPAGESVTKSSKMLFVLQEEGIFKVVAYEPHHAQPEWAYTLKNGWVRTEGTTSPRKFVLPNLRLSTLGGRGTRRIYTPYVDHIFFEGQVVRASLIADLAREGYATIPQKFETYYIRDGKFITEGKIRKSPEGFTTQFLRGVFGGAPTSLERFVPYREVAPEGDNWVVQSTLDYKNRQVPVFSNTEYAAAPRWFTHLAKGSVLTRESYTHMLLPVLQELASSVYVSPELAGIWRHHRGTGKMTRRIQLILTGIVKLFLAENSHFTQGGYGQTPEFFTGLLCSLEPFVLPLLYHIGFLQEKQVRLLLASVGTREPTLAPMKLTFEQGEVADKIHTFLVEQVKAFLTTSGYSREEKNKLRVYRSSEILKVFSNQVTCHLYHQMNVSVHSWDGIGGKVV